MMMVLTFKTRILKIIFFYFSILLQHIRPTSKCNGSLVQEKFQDLEWCGLYTIYIYFNQVLFSEVSSEYDFHTLKFFADVLNLKIWKLKILKV